jgi:hypothetical protein
MFAVKTSALIHAFRIKRNGSWFAEAAITRDCNTDE